MPVDMAGWLAGKGAKDTTFSASGIVVFSSSSLSASFTSAVKDALKNMPLAGQARGIGREMAGQQLAYTQPITR